MSKVFLDTNVLVYAIDRHDRRKRERCRELIRRLATTRSGALSTQVMQEFFVVATRKLGVDPLQAKGMLGGFGNFEIVEITPRRVYDAIDCSVIDQLSFWDALIVVCAEAASCEILATEDLSHDRVLRGVRVASPFA
jgi:predicted nucleic acid-binding protein